MVNTSLNWASIVGIVLAICGGGLYFLRSFKPALARDYDVFFAAIGLLCGGIFIFQGWRLDPILQVSIFLLTGTTVFFAYESVRLRGVSTDQARRSAYFEDDQLPNMPRSSSRTRFDEEYDQFEDSRRPARRFRPQEDDLDEDYMENRTRRRNVSRAIPSSAVSRRKPSSRDDNQFNIEDQRSRNISEDRLDNKSRRNNFGERRNSSRNELKRGSRPMANQEVSRQSNRVSSNSSSSLSNDSNKPSIRPQTKREKVEDASFQNMNDMKATRQVRRKPPTAKSTTKNQSSRYTVGTKNKKPRDNSSRFDD